MPAKLDRCVNDVKGEKGEDSAWAICTDSIKKEVSNATGITSPTSVAESHNPLDIVFGKEVPETVSVPSGASAVSIGGKKKIGEVNVNNTHDGKRKLEAVSNNVIKQILETKLGACPCKNKSRYKA